MFWIGFTLFSFLSFFFFYPSSSILCMVFDPIKSNIDKVLLIKPSANVFVLGDSNVHNKIWITYSARTDRPGELCYNFSISNVFTQMVSFLTQIHDCDSHSRSLTVTHIVLLFPIYLFLLTLVFVLSWLSFHYEMLIILLFQFPFTFCQTQIIRNNSETVKAVTLGFCSI